MTAPTPIPAEVLDAAAAKVLDILNREAILFPICPKSKRIAARVARVAIMQDRADRASQEERIREDERDRLYEKADRHQRQHARQFLGDNGAMFPADRARLRGGAS